MNKIYNSDCFAVFPLISNKSIDLVLVDLPYGQTDCHWDIKINLVDMWKELKRISKDNCQFVFFTTTKFGVELINSNPKWFRYDLVWEKGTNCGFLNSKYMPLRNHEMIYIFSYPGDDDAEGLRNKEMREYSNNVLKYINKPYNKIKNDLGDTSGQHFLQGSMTSMQFRLPTQQLYNKLIELYKINEMTGYKTFEEIINYKSLMKENTYNPQKTPGKPWKVKGHQIKMGVYGQKEIIDLENKTGDRHPKSVLKFLQNGDKLHPTQKPLELCEWLIKTYSNEGDLVFDFCMGSGTTIEASINTNRNYIGVEKDEKIFEVAKKRLEGK